MKMFLPLRRRGAFTLVELLTVMAIITVLISLIAPAVVGITMGSAVTRAGAQLEDAFNSAHQHALARQRETIVRLIKCPDPTNSGSAAAYRALQTFEVRDTGTKIPISGVTYMENTMVMMDNTQYSSMFLSNTDPAEQDSTSKDPKVRGAEQGYKYRDISFRPNGDTDLQNKELSPGYFISVASSRDRAPKNFYVVKVDPLTSKVTSYRP